MARTVDRACRPKYSILDRLADWFVESFVKVEMLDKSCSLSGQLAQTTGNVSLMSIEANRMLSCKVTFALPFKELEVLMHGQT